jgi:2-hydroxychromene-2-carboxylate isomerase
MHVDFHFDYSCPYAYLAATRIEAIAKDASATLAWKPMLLGGVFAAVGTPQRLFATHSPAKARHGADDLRRWAERFEVTLQMPAEHPFRTVEALRATLLASCDPKVIHGFFRAYWVDNAPISSEPVLRRVLAAAGHDADAILERLGDDAVKQELRARTDAAIALGVFGAPAMVVDGELEWGQDRLDVVARRLSGEPLTPGWGALAPTPITEDGHTPRTLEVWFDFSSPWAYLGATQVDALAARTGARVVWRPLLLGGLFRSIGQADVPLFTFSEAKQVFSWGWPRPTRRCSR